MKRVMTAFAMLLLCGQVLAATASEKRAAMHHLASAMAYERLCPLIAADKIKQAMLMKLTGIDPDGPDGGLIVFEAKSAMSRLSENSQDAVCAGGLLLYGPKGRKIQGLLHSVD